MRPPGELNSEDLRSLALNRAALARALSDWPRYAPKIWTNIATMRRAGAGSAAYLDRLEELVLEGPETLSDTLLRLDDEGQALRSVHPFAGLLTPQERTAIIRATSRHGASA